MSIVSNNIKYLRRLNGLTQEQFSRKIGIKRSLLGAYEEARAFPNPENLLNMANFFGVSVDTLMKTDIKRQHEAGKPSLPLVKEPTVHNSQLMGNNAGNSMPKSDLIEEIPEMLAASPFSPKSNQEIPFPNPAVLEPISPFIQAEETNPIPKQEIAFFPKSVEKAKPLSTVSMEWVSGQEMNNYLLSYAYVEYLKQLPLMQLPFLGNGTFRAFEMGTDFPQPSTAVAGQLVQNLHELKDGQHYLLIVHKRGLFYRRVYNQLKIRGVLLLTSDNPAFPVTEVAVREVLEAWEPRLFISMQLPQLVPTGLVAERLERIAAELKQEIEQLKSL
jgi:transcriptional regulator with XRE-family HTH domain